MSETSFAGRLRDERRRRGLNQTDFAALGGVKLRSQHGYESGKQVPSVDYLVALAEAGLDVHFLLSGSRDGNSLPGDASELVAIYCDLTGDMKDLLLQIARTLRDRAEAASTVHSVARSYHDG